MCFVGLLCMPSKHSCRAPTHASPYFEYEPRGWGVVVGDSAGGIVVNIPWNKYVSWQECKALKLQFWYSCVWRFPSPNSIVLVTVSKKLRFQDSVILMRKGFAIQFSMLRIDSGLTLLLTSLPACSLFFSFLLHIFLTVFFSRSLPLCLCVRLSFIGTKMWRKGENEISADWEKRRRGEE